jgi:hypothetical protein
VPDILNNGTDQLVEQLWFNYYGFYLQEILFIIVGCRSNTDFKRQAFGFDVVNN